MSMKASMGFFTVFISLFYVVGFGMLGYGLWSAVRSTHAADWPQTPGTVTSLVIKENHDSDGTTYEVQVEYTYTVAGQAHTGSRLAFGYGASSGHDAHDEIYRKLKDAKEVEVRYDPQNPETSVLSYGVHRSIQFTLAFAITWLAFVIGFTVMWWLFSQSDSVLLENLTTQ